MYGLFGQRNWGNEGSLIAALVNLKLFSGDLDIEVVCVCSNPDDVTEKYGITSFPIKCPPVRHLRTRNSFINKMVRRVFLRIPSEISHWLKGMKLLLGSNIMIAPGTGLLNDYASGAFGRPYDILIWSVLAKLCWCKLYFVSVGAGPIKSRISGLFIKLSMRMADYRSFRDEHSKNYVCNLGFYSKSDRIFPDLAFSLPDSMFDIEKKNANDVKIVGVGLKDYYGEEGMRDEGYGIYSDYLQKMGDFITWLIENKYTVRLLVGDSLYDEPVRNDLMEVMKNRGIQNIQEAVLFDPVTKVEELIDQISTVDIVISPRFHNIIYGIMLSKPVISLSYHRKFVPLMKDLGLSEYCQDLDHLDIGVLKDQFRRSIKNLELIILNLEKKREQYRQNAEEQYSLIFGDLHKLEKGIAS